MTKQGFTRSTSTVLLMGIAFAAHSEDLPIFKYEQIKNSQAFQFYIVGVESGFSFANVDLELAGKPRLYCPPKDKGITKEQIWQLVDRYVGIVRKDPTFLTQSPELQANYPVSLVLTRALQKEYPCNGK